MYKRDHSQIENVCEIVPPVAKRIHDRWYKRVDGSLQRWDKTETPCFPNGRWRNNVKKRKKWEYPEDLIAIYGETPPKAERVDGKMYVTRAGMVRTWNKKKGRFHRSIAKDAKAELARTGVEVESKTWNFIKKYGLTKAEYLEIFENQDNKCPLCDTFIEPISGPYGAHVDHKHVDAFDTMKAEEKKTHVRGILCASCNMCLGHIERNNYGVEWMKRVREYLY